MIQEACVSWAMAIKVGQEMGRKPVLCAAISTLATSEVRACCWKTVALHFREQTCYFAYLHQVHDLHQALLAICCLWRFMRYIFAQDRVCL